MALSPESDAPPKPVFGAPDGVAAGLDDEVGLTVAIVVTFAGFAVIDGDAEVLGFIVGLGETSARAAEAGPRASTAPAATTARIRGLFISNSEVAAHSAKGSGAAQWILIRSGPQDSIRHSQCKICRDFPGSPLRSGGNVRKVRSVSHNQ